MEVILDALIWKRTSISICLQEMEESGFHNVICSLGSTSFNWVNANYMYASIKCFVLNRKKTYLEMDGHTEWLNIEYVVHRDRTHAKKYFDMNGTVKST